MKYDVTHKYAADYLRELSVLALQELLRSAQQAFFDLRRQSSPHGRVKYVEKPHFFKKVKRDIARMKTIEAKS